MPEGLYLVMFQDKIVVNLTDLCWTNAFVYNNDRYMETACLTVW